MLLSILGMLKRELRTERPRIQGFLDAGGFPDTVRFAIALGAKCPGAHHQSADAWLAGGAARHGSGSPTLRRAPKNRKFRKFWVAKAAGAA